MTHFARVTNGIVTEVLVIDEETINTGLWGDPSEWVQTSYGTMEGVHYDEYGKPSKHQEKAIRGSFAGIGYIYDSVKDAFYPPNPPFPSWSISKDEKWWSAPVPKPTPSSDLYAVVWEEETLSWREIKRLDKGLA